MVGICKTQRKTKASHLYLFPVSYFVTLHCFLTLGRDFVGFYSSTIIGPGWPLDIFETCNVTGCGKVPKKYECFDILDEWTCDNVCGSNCTFGLNVFAWVWCLGQKFVGGIIGFLGGIFGIFG